MFKMYDLRTGEEVSDVTISNREYARELIEEILEEMEEAY
jgi:hypothetical protein